MCRDCWKTQPRNRPSFEDLGNTMRSVPKAPRAVSADGKDSGLPDTAASSPSGAGCQACWRLGRRALAGISVLLAFVFQSLPLIANPITLHYTYFFSALNVLLDRNNIPKKKTPSKKPRGVSTASDEPTLLPSAVPNASAAAILGSTLPIL